MYDKMLWMVLRPKGNEHKRAISVITLMRHFVMCTSKLILEGAVRCRFLVRYSVRMGDYNELQRIVFLEGLIVAELFKGRRLKADSHIACLAHAAPMTFPCRAVPLMV